MEEMTKALKLIKKTYDDIGDCSLCPLGNSENDCLLQKDVPCDWTIPETQVIRLLV